MSAGRISYFVAVNVNDAFRAGIDFNQRIGVGLGIGHRIGTGNSFHLAAFMEGTIRRFLRDGYAPLIGQPLPAFPTAGGPAASLTSSNMNDDPYFVSRPVLSVGIKFIYLVTGGTPKISIK